MVVPVQKREDDILPLLYALWLSKNITLGGQKRAYSTFYSTFTEYSRNIFNIVIFINSVQLPPQLLLLNIPGNFQ